MLTPISSAPKQRAFSLVELSIVLVILGLLIGGILSGQALIRAAEMRSVTTQYNLYATAMQTFRDKYFAFPGDITNATAFWGKDNVNCSGDTGTTATPGTCNGNGNGIMEAYDTPPSREQLHFWQQLSLAGLIEGGYTGLGAPSSLNATLAVGVPGVNIPKSKASNSAGWTPFYLPQHNSEAGVFTDLPAISYNFMVLAGAVDHYWANQANVFKPEEVWNLDTKMDDGRPAFGILRGAAGTPCLTGTTSAAQYNLTATGTVCNIAFKMGI
jgi:prepilin-type N-terminal cleavage/methylation domain-containing protein